MEFLWRQTIACRENVTMWTERQTDKIRNDTFRNAQKRYRVHIVLGFYTRKNAQLVTNLQQTCTKLVGTSLLQDLFALLVPACQVVPATCYRAASQQVVSNKLGTT